MLAEDIFTISRFYSIKWLPKIQHLVLSTFKKMVSRVYIAKYVPPKQNITLKEDQQKCKYLCFLKEFKAFN